MKISLIVAVGKNLEIGLNKELPWKLPADLKKFKELTLGHHLVMGRKTFESIGKPLPYRDSIIISGNPETLNFYTKEPGVFVVDSLHAAVDLARQRGETEVFICGGGKVYQEALLMADLLYLTEVAYGGPADTFFPDYRELEWELLSEEKFPADIKNPYDFIFKVLQRNIPSLPYPEK